MRQRDFTRVLPLLFVLTGAVSLFTFTAGADEKVRRISVDDYRDKMAGGWLGQMIGVGWGEPTESTSNGRIIPESDVPQWTPQTINQFANDDLYVEMIFLRSLEKYGFDVSYQQAGIDFANNDYGLWHANRAGRENLRNGIAPPDSGHPQFNTHADDIDYQIEADYAGLISPGMPNMGIELGEKFGRITNYGDGLYAGQFISGMYTEAFFETDPEKIILAGLACIPEKSHYAETISDTVRWSKENPDDWEETWHLVEEKYNQNTDYRRFSCTLGLNIDAKLNAAYAVMGLLYGKRDIEQTVIISMRCGQDSDCNPSSAMGVLGTTLGAKNLPEKYTLGLDHSTKFRHSDYNFEKVFDVCEQLAREAVVRQGGKIEKINGKEFFLIPVREPRLKPLEQCWEPGPIANSRYTPEEMKMIRFGFSSEEIKEFTHDWTMKNCGEDMSPGLRAEWRGRKNVFVTHPLDHDVPCSLSRTAETPSGKKTFLVIEVANTPDCDFQLVVKANDKIIADQTIANIGDEVWRTVEVDLSEFSGTTVEIEVQNKVHGHFLCEAAYWGRIEIQSR